MKFVTIPHSTPFIMSETVVTQDQWKKVMGTEPWKAKLKVNEGDDYPAVYVSCNDAVEFCRRLSVNGETYRLPTEAEWQFACRGGSTTNFHFGNEESRLAQYAWYWRNCQDEQYAHRVAQKLPNQYELYDMHGNVWEWCSDDFGDDDCNVSNVIKGGSWFDIAIYARSAFRNYRDQNYAYFNIGFRIVADL